jgi:asparagine synthase (glutamine-hydrolysing)
MIRAGIEGFPHFDKVAINLRDECFELDSIDESMATSLPASSSALGIAYSPNESNCLATGDPKSSFATMSGRIFNQPDAPASLIQLLKTDLGATGNIESAFKRLVESLDGQYAFVLRWGDEFLLARDMVGVKPLYIAEDDHLVVFSSRRKPLWTMGLASCRSLAQPTLVSEKGIRTISTGMRIEPLKLEEKQVVESLTTLLSEALAKMVSKQKRIGILFSGGLDSSIIAKLSKDLGSKCTLYCAGTPSSRDMVNARRMSSALDIQLVQKEISYDEIADKLLDVIKLVESTDMIHVSTSVPIFFAVKESAKTGERIILHGQGADELYGGYERYESALAKYGYAAVCSEMLNDVMELANVIPQYDQMGTSVSAQMLAPFLDASVLRFSLGIPIRFKLHKEGLRVTRKYILWQVASRLGIPTELLPTQKVAAQFGSGVARIMDLIARRAGFSKRVARASGLALPIQAYLKGIGESAEFPS